MREDTLLSLGVSVKTEVKEKIISGEITVPDSKDAFEAAYGDVYELD